MERCWQASSSGSKCREPGKERRDQALSSHRRVALDGSREPWHLQGVGPQVGVKKEAIDGDPWWHCVSTQVPDGRLDNFQSREVKWEGSHGCIELGD